MIDLGNLVNELIVESVFLAKDGGAGEVGEFGGVGVLGIFLHDHDHFVIDIRIGEVGRLGSLGRDRHASADDIDGAVAKSVDERAKLHLDGDGLHVESFSNALGDLHVIAVGISARDVLDGDRGVGFGRLLPVVGGVCGLHADAQGLAVTELADGFLGGAGFRGTRVGAGGLCCRAAAGKERCTRNGECGDAAEFEEIAA